MSQALGVCFNHAVSASCVLGLKAFVPAFSGTLVGCASAAVPVGLAETYIQNKNPGVITKIALRALEGISLVAAAFVAWKWMAFLGTAYTLKTFALTVATFMTISAIASLFSKK
jgi:hypothetical protein